MATSQALLLKRLNSVLSKWSPDASRRGRDLGEFLSHTYKARFLEGNISNASKAMEEIESLEKLSSDYYRKKYQRETEYGFSGEQTFPSHILSNENMKKLRKVSLWDRIRKRGN